MVDENAALGARILVVDDEPSIVDSISTVLRYEGYEVHLADSGQDALELARRVQLDLVILDVMLPDVDGFEVTRRLRSEGIEIPVLFLTAKTGVDDRVTGLSIGGDDYVTKPFALREIVARTQVILRRRHPPSEDRQLKFADLVMDEESRQVWRGGIAVHFSATEFNLLRLFMLNPKRVLPKDQIIEHIWHYDFDGNHNILETYVRYVRRKLDAIGPPLIHTVRLVGYVLREDE